MANSEDFTDQVQNTQKKDAKSQELEVKLKLQLHKLKKEMTSDVAKQIKGIEEKHKSEIDTLQIMLENAVGIQYENEIMVEDQESEKPEGIIEQDDEGNSDEESKSTKAKKKSQRISLKMGT